MKDVFPASSDFSTHLRAELPLKVECEPHPPHSGLECYATLNVKQSWMEICIFVASPEQLEQIGHAALAGAANFRAMLTPHIPVLPDPPSEIVPAFNEANDQAQGYNRSTDETNSQEIDRVALAAAVEEVRQVNADRTKERKAAEESGEPF